MLAFMKFFKYEQEETFMCSVAKRKLTSEAGFCEKILIWAILLRTPGMMQLYAIYGYILPKYIN